MVSIYYIGLDVLKKFIAYCIKTITGKIVCKRNGESGTSGTVGGIRCMDMSLFL